MAVKYFCDLCDNENEKVSGQYETYFINLGEHGDQAYCYDIICRKCYYKLKETVARLEGKGK